MRNPKRTAASASALVMGVGLVGFSTILAASTKTSINAAIDRSVTGDLVVNAGSGFFGGVDAGFAKRLDSVPELESATGMRVGGAKIADKVERVGAVDARSGFAIIDVEPVEGRPQDMGRDTRRRPRAHQGCTTGGARGTAGGLNERGQACPAFLRPQEGYEAVCDDSATRR